MIEVDGKKKLLEMEGDPNYSYEVALKFRLRDIDNSERGLKLGKEARRLERIEVDGLLKNQPVDPGLRFQYEKLRDVLGREKTAGTK